MARTKVGALTDKEKVEAESIRKFLLDKTGLNYTHLSKWVARYLTERDDDRLIADLNRQERTCGDRSWFLW